MCVVSPSLPLVLPSYKQVRSIASSVAVQAERVRRLRRASKGSPRDSAALDFFTLDFGEEASALFSQLAWDQAEFVNDAVRTIRHVYAKRGML